MNSFKLKLAVLSCFLFLGIIPRTEARIWLPDLLTDGMVLQQKSEVTLWGWTDAVDEEITIYGSWNNEKIKVKADVARWEIRIPTPEAGGPYQIHIEGHDSVVIRDVLIGEVWICSGQSNMEWTADKEIDNAEAEIAAANYPEIRFFQVPKRWSDTPQENVTGDWKAASPETMKNFSAVAYFFARKVFKETGVPIGLISSNWGGTPVETWIPKEKHQQHPNLVEAARLQKKVAWWPIEVGRCYNAMIHPLTKMTITGAIWYQGESNLVNGYSYYNSFPLMIECWREVWGQDFPFYFVQIAPYKYEGSELRNAAVVRDAQLHTLKTVPQTGMVVTTDIGNLEDIHPRNKQDVGARLALWSLAKIHGKDITYSGPVYKEMEVNGKRAVLQFDHAENGLLMKGKTLSDFEIAGADQEFYPAEAKIKGNTVEVWSKKVASPEAVRFGFTNGAEPNLFNREGLPATPFRTDTWTINLDD